MSTGQAGGADDEAPKFPWNWAPKAAASLSGLGGEAFLGGIEASRLPGLSYAAELLCGAAPSYSLSFLDAAMT